MAGKLYIVATPIGNLGDIPPRTAVALCEADLILAEDTRVTLKLLNHLGLRKRLLSCHEYNEEKRTDVLAEAAAENQSVALLSDAGTPLVSDPGFRIVAVAIALQMQIVPLPGPSAFLLALVGSGLPCERFIFEGFLSDRTSIARERLEQLKDERRTLVFYVAPHKLKKTMQNIAEVFGDRPACLARELTKLHEEFIRGHLFELIDRLRVWEPRGECVLVVGGNTQPVERPSDEEILKSIKDQMRSGKKLKEIAATVATAFRLRKSQVYKLALDVELDDDQFVE